MLYGSSRHKHNNNLQAIHHPNTLFSQRAKMLNCAGLAHRALLTPDVAGKAALLEQMRDATDLCKLAFCHDGVDRDLLKPAMPAGLALVHPKNLKRRGLHTDEGKACFLHAIAHIEYNAINLALDAIYRFPGLPGQYYLDWLFVAEQEVDHHQRVVHSLSDAGYAYGDFPAHNGLWDMAVRTADDLLSRMAMVPCVFEARGLDVSPPMIEKLNNAGDPAAAALLQFILDEEVGHVEVGVRWYHYVCRQQGLEPVETFMTLLGRYLPNKPQGPFNVPDRLKAGFTRDWISRLQQLSG